MDRRPIFIVMLPYLLFAAAISISGACFAFQSPQPVIEIQVPANAVIADQDEDSIDLELPTGTGSAALTNWLTQFRSAGWQIELVDQDSMSAEYQLKRGAQTLAIELDSPGIDVDEILVSCDSDNCLKLAGVDLPSAKLVPTAQNNPMTSAPINTRPGETWLGSVAGVNWEIDPESARDWWISPNHQRFARRMATASGTTVVVDGVSMGEWNSVPSHVVFSPDNQHHAFVSNRNGDSGLEFFLVVDGKPGNPWENMTSELSFTADSARVLVGTNRNGKKQVHVRPVSSDKPATDLPHSFAADAEVFFHDKLGHVGYVARYSEREFGVVWNEQELGPRFEQIDPQNVAVTADGKHVGFLASLSPVRVGVVVDGATVYEHNQFEYGTVFDGTLAISPNGKRWGFVATQKQGEVAIIDGRGSSAYKSVDLPEFSPDSTHVSFLAMKGESPVLVFDGQESRQYAMIGLPEYSPDSRMIAYYAEIGGKQFMLVNGRRQMESDEVFRPYISDDGHTVAYNAVLDDRDYVVINGQKQTEHDVVGFIRPIPNSTRLSWVVWDNDRDWRLVIDRVEQPYRMEELLGPPAFSADGKVVALPGSRDGRWSVYLNGRAGEQYDQIVRDWEQGLSFDSQNRCQFMAVREGHLFFVQRQ